jgi:hypothetical protein
MNNYKIDELKDTIIKALELYDEINYKYSKELETEIEIQNYKAIFNINDKIIKYDYEILGYYDIPSKVWTWGWLLPIYNDLTLLSRDILNYGLKLDVVSINAIQIFFKTLLLNSRYIVSDFVGLEINIAIFFYLLKNKVLFIYPHKENNVIKYYIIMNNDSKNISDISSIGLNLTDEDINV